MKLIIDYGNTLIKTAVFHDDSIIHLQTYTNSQFKQFKLQIDKFKHKESEYKAIKYVILSSVADFPNDTKVYLKSKYSFFELNSRTALPVEIKYKTPDTLGNDRIAAVVGGSYIFPSSDLLVIDAGTCITYDFINSTKQYYGGGISPGINMRFKALNNFTDKLPLVSLSQNFNLIGNSTKDSILSGVLNGIIAEVDGIIDKYKREFPDLKIIFTGGDANYFDKKLKNDIFADSNLVLKGLNIILNFNLEE